MEAFQQFVGKAADVVWGPITIILLVGTGLYLSLGTRFIQFREMKNSIKLMFQENEGAEGDITPFQALSTSMAATVGTGNIVGVSSAIVSGGPGAVFWMWVSGAVGGATKYAEALLAVKYRETNEKGEKIGGPMNYISKGIKEQYDKNADWLGFAFALFAVIASFGIGNMTQANSISESVEVAFGIKPAITGAILAFLVGAVIIGGIKSIGKVTEKVVPAMALFYILGGLIAILANASAIPGTFKMIFANAFSGRAVGGGLLGTVIRFGIARGVFSNEAGLGSSPIAHAASKNDDPVAEGIIASIAAFIDTIIVCTMTALVILTSGLVKVNEAGAMVIENNLEGASLTTTAFGTLLPNFGTYIIPLGLVLFAFSTILGWYYYGSKSLEYIAGLNAVKYYNWIWVVLSFVGAVASLDIVWGISDVFNGLMAVPNLIGLLALSPLVFQMTREYDGNVGLGEVGTKKRLSTSRAGK
ncbi:MAG TPA: sodium:alanine symporter family protein [Tissierellales bacterium]|nr:sodium:alanine symporter family protein [Tissierellales bacterium]